MGGPSRMGQGSVMGSSKMGFRGIGSSMIQNMIRK